MDVVTGPKACARFKAGFESFGGGGERSWEYFMWYFMCRAWAFCPPLIGPADPPAQYFLERIRRTAARISTVAGLHRALERIKWVQLCAHLLMTPSPRPSRKVELKLKTRKVQRKVVRVPSRRRGKALDFIDNLGMGRNHLRAQISNTSIIAVILLFCRMRTWFPWTWYMRPHLIVSMRFTIFPSTVFFSSLHWHLVPLTFIEYFWKDRSDQLMR